MIFLKWQENTCYTKTRENENCCRLFFYVQAQHVNGTTDAVVEEDLWSRAESLVIFGQRRKGVRFAKDNCDMNTQKWRSERRTKKTKNSFFTRQKVMPQKGAAISYRHQIENVSTNRKNNCTVECAMVHENKIAKTIPQTITHWLFS